MVNNDILQSAGISLANPSLPLKQRFRALFALKNLGGEAAVDLIAKNFSDPSALLKHELAYCLGQIRDKNAVPILLDVLRDSRQEPIVRHEAGTIFSVFRVFTCSFRRSTCCYWS